MSADGKDTRRERRYPIAVDAHVYKTISAQLQ